MRKQIKIDMNKVAEIKKRHEASSARLSEFLGEDPTEVGEVVVGQKVEKTLEDIFG